MDPIESDIAAIARVAAVPTILKVISEVTGLRLTLVARVTEDAWTACAALDRMDFGLVPGGTLDVTTTLCSEVRDARKPIVIEHASRDPAFCGHPTPRMYGFESYISVPLYRQSGEYFGTLCGLDSRPLPLADGKTLAMFELFAELISVQLAADEAHARDRDALVDERRTGELREQFIAVLGHDLRSALSSVVTGSAFLLDVAEAARDRTVLQRIRRSGERMARLIDDVMDFARGRLGGGIAVAPSEGEDVAALVNHVVAEIASAHPEREIRVSLRGAGTASFDPSRMAQLMSNLVGNAVEHSPASEPVEVALEGSESAIRFSVTNRGEPIAADLLSRLFKPYVRAVGDRPRPGLGLGLYIASEIARSHGGTITAMSNARDGTTFVAEVPRRGAVQA